MNGCTDIPNATNSSYTLQASDVLDSVDVAVTASNVAGSASAVSKPTGVITHSGDPVVVARRRHRLPGRGSHQQLQTAADGIARGRAESRRRTRAG